MNTKNKKKSLCSFIIPDLGPGTLYFNMVALLFLFVFLVFLFVFLVFFILLNLVANW